MGLFEQLTGALFSNKSKLMDDVVDWIEQQGNMSGIIDKFKQAGFAEIAESWISNGENMLVSIEQIKQTFDLDAIKQLSQKINLDTDSTCGFLAKYLPQVISDISSKGLSIDNISNINLT